MDKLQQLDCLWLNENLIETIKGFDKLGRNLLSCISATIGSGGSVG
jgi:hypothetical protein